MSQRRENGEKILVTRSFMPSYEKYTEMIKPIQDNAWLTSMSDSYKRLEQELKDYMGISNLTLFVNGCMALEMAIQALNLIGEVIIMSFTSASITHAIVCNGPIPIFCDINPLDYTMDVEQIESLVTDKTSAIILVHVYGNICDVKRIDAIAKKCELKATCSAAHTSGERYKGKNVAEFGGTSIFSPHATKVSNTVEGGTVSFAEEWMDHKLNCLKSYGIVDQGHVVWVGGNAKMSEFQAAMGLCNLRHLDDEIEKRKMVTGHYRENLGGVPRLKLPAYKEGPMPNYVYFPVVFDGFKMDRNEVCDRLAEHNTSLRKYFHPLTNGLQCYSDRFSPGDTPAAACMANWVLALPLYAGPSSGQADRICRVMKDIQVDGTGREDEHLAYKCGQGKLPGPIF